MSSDRSPDPLGSPDPLAIGPLSSGDGAPPEPPAFILNPSVRVVFCGEDEVLVLHGARSDFRRTIKDEGRTKLLGRVLRNMAEPTSLDALHRRGIVQEGELSSAQALVEHLVAERVIVRPEWDPTAVYLNTLYGEPSPLSARSVGIAGVGYLGARVAGELARLGVGHIELLDDREVEHLDVERRQFPFRPALLEAGTPYASAALAYLEELGYPHAAVDARSPDDPAAAQDLFDRCDFVVAAADVFTSALFHTADMASIGVGKPWISAYMDGSEACVGPLYVPGETCCYNEFEIQNEASLSISPADYFAQKEALNRHGLRSRHYVLPAHLTAAAGLLAGAAASFLAYGRSHLVNRCLRLNLERPYVDYEEVLRLPRSPATAATRHGYRHVFM